VKNKHQRWHLAAKPASWRQWRINVTGMSKPAENQRSLAQSSVARKKEMAKKISLWRENKLMTITAIEGISSENVMAHGGQRKSAAAKKSKAHLEKRSSVS
jgi:hypothetical protein